MVADSVAALFSSQYCYGYIPLICIQERTLSERSEITTYDKCLHCSRGIRKNLKCIFY
jgi:hypothetical protein